MLDDPLHNSRPIIARHSPKLIQQRNQTSKEAEKEKKRTAAPNPSSIMMFTSLSVVSSRPTKEETGH